MPTLPSSAPFPITCGFLFVPTSLGGGTVTTQQCGIAAVTPPNPATAYAFKNLQALPLNDWTICAGQCPITGPPNTGCCGNLSNGIHSPSMSGSAMEAEDSSTTSYYDVLFTSNGNNQLDWNLQSGCGAPPCRFQNFLDDVWFYVPSASLPSLENLEFDPDYTDPDGYTYKMSVECTTSNNAGKPNVWQFWNQTLRNGAGDWQTTGQSCANVWANPNTWFHLQIYTTVNASHQYNYQGLALAPQNGQFTYFSWGGMTNFISGKQNFWNPDLFVETEIDNAGPGDTKVYYDQYSLIVW